MVLYSVFLYVVSLVPVIEITNSTMALYKNMK